MCFGKLKNLVSLTCDSYCIVRFVCLPEMILFQFGKSCKVQPYSPKCKDESDILCNDECKPDGFDGSFTMKARLALSGSLTCGTKTLLRWAWSWMSQIVLLFALNLIA